MSASDPARLRLVLVDDEPPALRHLQRCAAAHADVEVVGLAADGDEAVRVLRASRPELVFMDICMPGLDGFGVVDAVGPKAMPSVVFVTAWDRFAVHAFEIHALDYLLKPYDQQRFDVALQRGREDVALRGQRQGLGRLDALLAHRVAGDRPPERLLLTEGGGALACVELTAVRWIEAAGNYLRVHHTGGTALLRETMQAASERLAAAGFVRIHRSRLVRLSVVRRLSGDNEHLEVELDDGTRLGVGRRAAPAVRQALRQQRDR